MASETRSQEDRAGTCPFVLSWDFFTLYPGSEVIISYLSTSGQRDGLIGKALTSKARGPEFGSPILYEKLGTIALERWGTRGSLELAGQLV